MRFRVGAEYRFYPRDAFGFRLPFTGHIRDKHQVSRFDLVVSPYSAETRGGDRDPKIGSVVRQSDSSVVLDILPELANRHPGSEFVGRDAEYQTEPDPESAVSVEDDFFSASAAASSCSSPNPLNFMYASNIGSRSSSG